MSELTAEINKLKRAIDTAYQSLSIDERAQELAEGEKKAQDSGFWSNAIEATAYVKQLATMRSFIEPWQKLKKDIDELSELDNLGDSSLTEDIHKMLIRIKHELDVHKQDVVFSGPYDDHNVVMSIYAGAGGTDAQDWARMLCRMYSRWTEQHNGTIDIIEQSIGDEAGLKHITLEIDIPFAYGKLKGEHGVHRLVRLSPFNADNLRQTSFAKVDVLPKIDKPNEILLADKDLKIEVFRAGGHGGQSVNTTDSAVRVTHIPSGITVSIQNERSQLQNKETALTILRSRLAQLQLEQHKVALSDIKGPIKSAEWGNQIRSYVLHPYKQVKDLRTRYESSDPQRILDGELDGFIEAFQNGSLSS